MTDTTMHQEFEAWCERTKRDTLLDKTKEFYWYAETDAAWFAWQAATERATAIERESCAVLCEEEGRENMRKFQDTGSAFRENYAIGAEQCAAAIRQGYSK